MCFNVCRVCPKRDGYAEESQQQFSASAPPASLSLLGNFEVQQAIAVVMPSVQPAPEPKMATVGTNVLFGRCCVWFETISNLAKNTNFRCVIELKTVGMCAELPPGAFRASGGFHCRCGRQRLLLSQSPDLTCRCVILQCLRWQRSLTIYGETGSPKMFDQ